MFSCARDPKARGMLFSQRVVPKCVIGFPGRLAWIRVPCFAPDERPEGVGWLPRAHWPKACGILSPARGPKASGMYFQARDRKACGMFPLARDPKACGMFSFCVTEGVWHAFPGTWPVGVWHVFPTVRGPEARGMFFPSAWFVWGALPSLVVGCSGCLARRRVPLFFPSASSEGVW